MPHTTEEGFKARFHGKIYNVRPTKVMRKSVKAHTDLNGYEVEPHVVKSQQLGMFLEDRLCFTVKMFNGTYQVYSNGQRYGSISPMLAHHPTK